MKMPEEKSDGTSCGLIATEKGFATEEKFLRDGAREGTIDPS